MYRCGPVTNPDLPTDPRTQPGAEPEQVLHDKIPSSYQGLCNASSASVGSDGQVTEPGISALLREGNLCRTSMAQCKCELQPLLPQPRRPSCPNNPTDVT